MTVLVMDHPDLMKRLAGLATTPNQRAPARPHRMRFHFGFNQHRTSGEDSDFLRQHGAWLRDHPGLRVRLHSHTDNFGTRAYNLFLSRKRANTARQLLIEGGARASQITLCCHGSDQPLARPEDHGANRRLQLEYPGQPLARAL